MSSEVPPETVADASTEEVVPPVESLVDSPNFVYMAGLAALAIIGGAAYYFLVLSKKKKRKLVDLDESLTTNSVGLDDINYIVSKLNPKSSHMDVLWAVISTPESIAYGLRTHNAKEKVRSERIASDKEEAKKGKSTKQDSADMFNFDDDGWAEDEDDDMDEEAKRKAQLAKEAEEQKKKDREQLKKATGKTKIKLEGIDDGVIGQQWVENTLAANGAWPPKDFGILEGVKFSYNGKKVSALEHPGLRRNICMMMGRLNSVLLNSHPELLEAGSKQLVDQTYFKGSMEFRGRCGLLLEAALRSACTLRNSALTKTIVETVSMFKVGCNSPDKVDWFNGIMQKQYQCLPRVKVENTFIECTGEENMATGDVLAIGLELTRVHAEAFTRQKIAMFQKQGIPPQVALQTYREGWWFLVQAERLDGETPKSALTIKTDGMLKDVAKKDIAKYEEASFEERLLTAWPMMVQNVAQKTGKVKLQVLAPSVPGKYKFNVIVKSQEFLGADEEFSVEGVILDGATVTRKPKESKEPQDDTEAKKDK